MATTISGPGRRIGRGVLHWILGMVDLGTVIALATLAMPRPASGTPPELAAVPGGTADWWSAVTESIERDEYKFTVAEAGLQAPNRAHNFRSRYRETGVEIEPRERNAEEAVLWRLSWRTKAWGRSGAMNEVGPASPEVNAEGVRVTYRHDGMSEWYENRKEGLEQGFTLEERPAGDGSLRIEGEFGGAARPVLGEDGTIDLLAENDVAILRYSDLAVFDATGKEVSASLTVAGSTVAIVVDDRSAAYPLVVDPLMTTPAWIAEANQTDADFGSSVATAGDVNKDGYSDVIIGAPRYDGGNANEGRAYVFDGSPLGLASVPSWTAESDQEDARFGDEVATAGDVNGDEYADVIVSATWYSNVEFNEGRCYVYHGSSGGLGTLPAWTQDGQQENAGFGWSVSTAGDVNGDGYSDVIVGAIGFDNIHIDEGRAYLYSGSSTGLIQSPVWFTEANQTDSFLGKSVSTAGDVNGDGYSDVIIGAYEYFDDIPFEGQVQVFHGSAAWLGPTPNWTATGNQYLAHFGWSVATAGDVNGDGFSDVIIGAEGFENGQPDEGRALVYLGSPAGLIVNNTAAWTAESNQAYARFGWSVAPAGDVNGDGYADVIVGAPFFDNGHTDEGRAYAYHGSALGLSAAPDWTAESNQIDAQYGNSVATAGDVNGDGRSDAIVGAPSFDNGHTDEGRAYVYHGAGVGLGTTSAWTAESNQASANFGTSVSTAGDVNGDGYSDVIVGADRYDNGQENEGRAFVYHGRPTGPATTASWTAESNQASALFGQSVASAGDVNNDGYSDVIVGSPFFDNGQTDEGRTYIYHGSPSGLSTTAARTLESNQATAYFGVSAATAGDVNGDGYADVIVGAWQYDNGQSNEGRAFTYHGSATGIGTTAARTVESNQVDAWFGHPVGTAGDVNSDGFSDVIIGANFFDNGQTNEGRAFVYHGSGSGLGATPAWTGESNTAGSDYGWSASTAGDVNGDGYSDVIVGAPRYNGSTGRVYAYHGSASGLGATPHWTRDGDQAAAWFGTDVSTAGDVNGDGFSDVVVSADRYDNGQNEEGRVYGYHGTAAGLGATPSWTVESNQASANFGRSLSTAGDVNGDGYSDVIIGSWIYDNGQTDEGRAFIYYGNNASRLIRPRSVRVVEDTPIAPLGRSDSPSAFRLEAIGLSAGGRSRVWLEYEVEPLGVLFDGLGLLRGPVQDTGFPQNLGSLVLLKETPSGLSPDTPYHWRLRVATDSPFFPWSRWVSPIGNAPSEADLRTAAGSLAVATGLGSPGAHLLASATPNPFNTSIELGYSLPEAGRLRLRVYSVTGREVVGLVDEVQNAGEYSVRWDGRDREGRLLPAGVYFAQLELGDRIESQKLVIAR